MRKGSQIILLTCLSAYSITTLASWETTVDTDEMTGEVKAYAFSSSVQATKPMSFPYKGVTAWLGVGCSPKKSWTYIGFSSAPNVTNTETKSGYNQITTRIKWNDKVESIKLTQDWGAKSIHFSNDDIIIKKLAKSNSFMLELDWHGQGNRFFKFDLSGSSNALKTIGKECNFKLEKITFNDKFRIALSEMSFYNSYRISINKNTVSVETQGGDWKPFARDNSVIDKLSLALKTINKVAYKKSNKYKLSINVWGSTTYEKQNRDGAHPFSGTELKKLLDESINNNSSIKNHISSIEVGEKDPIRYGEDSSRLLKGKIKSTNEKIEITVSFPSS